MLSDQSLGLTQPGKTIVCGDRIHLHMVPLVQLHLVLEQLKLNMYYQHKHYGKKTKNNGNSCEW